MKSRYQYDNKVLSKECLENLAGMLKMKSRGQSKVVAVHLNQALRGGVSVALPTLNRGASMVVGVQHHAPAALTPGKRCGTYIPKVLLSV